MNLFANDSLLKTIQLFLDTLEKLVFAGPVDIIIAVISFTALVLSKEAGRIQMITAFKKA